MRNISRGFTLIELLVVIAIISLLTSIVMASLASARNKAADTAVKQNINGARTSAQLYHNLMGKYSATTGSDYQGNCLTNATVFRETTLTGPARTAADAVEAAIQKAVETGRGGKQCRTNAERTQYMIAVQLKSTTAYWCVDSEGTQMELSALPATGQFLCQ